ncbi:50S ribosome-binding GTPase [Microbacterium aoyamense]|uniref:50S ribosome-binding GTPase n=1 Tax=Microbacterium aoyamense TaxID=344166 RepID=A0ABP5B346_9MICO|nr:dynamin family protein [Microbacterium aoyamense]
MHAGLRELSSLLDAAREVYGDDEDAVGRLDEWIGRIHEPLRLAVAGMVKAGKSTLLNALIGEKIAPTDAGECTRTITWYRYGQTAKITLHLANGAEEQLPVRRVDGQLVLDLEGRTADDVARIEVEWPSESLRSLILIDTPGIGSLSEAVSARSFRFLTPDDSESGADAILYLLRHVHSTDVGFLEAFRDSAAGSAHAVNAVALLSRADEIGSGRIDSLLSAAQIAGRYRRDGDLRTLALDCIPVAGLLAEAARTLRESEFAAFRELADLDREVRDRMLISVDRFTRPFEDATLTVETRRALLDRFGLFGVRLGAALVRGGATSSSDLRDRMVQQSGLVDVQRFVADQFRSRAAALKARGALQVVETLLRERPIDGSQELQGAIERLRAGEHDLRELELLAALRSADLGLDQQDHAEAERLIGGDGTTPSARLGLAVSATDQQAASRVRDVLAHWHALAESPVTDRGAADLARVVIRSAEGAASELGVADGRLGSASDVVTTGAPA